MDLKDIYQITLPLPFRLDHVHCYLVKGENGWTVIDSGLHTEGTRKAWEKAFLSYSIDPKKEIEKIVLTHYHPDHFGFAGSLQEWTGASVHISAVGKDRALSNWTEQRFIENRHFYRINGLPEEMNQELAKNDQVFFSRVRPFPRNFEVIEGADIPISDGTFEVIPTPGHAEGHLCFYHREKQILIGGDLLLKKITPNISYHGYGDSNPLASYFQSLEKLKGYDIQVIYPGHGPIFKDAHARIQELMNHHKKRLTQITQLVQGECTGWQICKQLFNRELSIHEIRFAMGETMAHLRYLLEEGEIKQESAPSGMNFYMR